MGPRVRRVALTAHVVASVGWLGAVAAFFALAVTGLAAADAQKARAAYVAMEVAARLVIVPLCLASLLTGVLQGLGTPWGLFRHHWVVLKLAITVLSTLVLLVHLQPIAYLGDMALDAPFGGQEHRDLRLQLAVNSGAALAALLVATTLAVVKPRGMTRYGRRRRREERAPPSP